MPSMHAPFKRYINIMHSQIANIAIGYWIQHRDLIIPRRTLVQAQSFSIALNSVHSFYICIKTSNGSWILKKRLNCYQVTVTRK